MIYVAQFNHENMMSHCTACHIIHNAFLSHIILERCKSALKMLVTSPEHNVQLHDYYT